MIAIVLSILCSTLLYVNFKLFARFQVKTLQAIVINYTVCVIVGLLNEGALKSFQSIVHAAWFAHAILMGSLFITIFYITALSVKTSGIAITSVAGKLSLIIPTALAFLLYGDEITFLKLTGISFALAAIFLITFRKNDGASQLSYKFFLFPLLILVGNGIIDAYANYCQREFIEPADFNFFLVFVFGTAAFTGWLTLLYRRMMFNEVLSIKSLLFGITLGVPNYGSMYFLIMALESSGIESSVFFPVNNIAILLLSCVIGSLFFKEKLSALNLFGIVISIVAIIFMMQ